MKIPYTFTILRYVHDVLSGEFINVGVVLYAPQARFLDAKFTTRYVRLSKMFNDVNGEHFRHNIKYIRDNLDVCKEAAVNKNREVAWDELLAADDRRRLARYSGYDGHVRHKAKGRQIMSRHIRRGTTKATIEHAIDSLPPAYRSVFVMREVERLSTSETAESLVLSEDAIKMRLHRARGMLREDLLQRAGTATAQVMRFDGERCVRMVRQTMARIMAEPKPPRH